VTGGGAFRARTGLRVHRLDPFARRGRPDAHLQQLADRSHLDKGMAQGTLRHDR